jgi:NTE family protein
MIAGNPMADPPAAPPAPERINLIMAGGGVRFPAYVGALAAFGEMGVEIVNVAGASAGSIVGCFLAAGWPVKDMYLKLLETDFRRFKDFSLRGLLFEGGIYSGDAFENWIETELHGATFEQLPHDLYVAAVDLVHREPFFFSRRTTPGVKVSKAVRCSMSIPWVWRAQRFEKRLLVDGQLLPWIPSGIGMLEECGPPVSRTVMLRMVSDGPKALPNKKHLWPWDFAKILLETMLSALENQRVPGSLWQDTILIQVSGIQTLQLDLGPAEKERLFQCGYDQAKRYFRKQPAP